MNSDPKRRDPKRELRYLFASLDRFLLLAVSRQAMLLYGVVGAIGGVILLVGKFPEILSRVQSLSIQQIGFYLLVFPFGVLFTALYFRSFVRIYRRRVLGDDPEDFLSVDRRAASRRHKEVSTAEQILMQIKRAEARTETFNYEKIREIVEQTIKRNDKKKP